MLLTHKYHPKKFSDAKINLSIVQKVKNISSIDFFHNIFIYGSNGTGKYTTANMILENMYGPDIYLKTTRQFDYTINNTAKSIEVTYSKYHYEIYFNNNYNFDYGCICEFIKENSKNHNILNNNYKVILFRNVQYLNKDIYNNIKIISEKYNQNCRFILICNSICNVPKNMFGYFFFIKMNYLKNDENLKPYLISICEKEKIAMKGDKLDKLLQKYNYNLNIIFSYMDLIKQNKNYNLIDPIEQRYKKIICLINKKSIHEFEKMRKELYELTSSNVNKIDLIKYLFNYYFEKTKNKYELISFTNKILMGIGNSYRDLFHLEYFVMNMIEFIE